MSYTDLKVAVKNALVEGNCNILKHVEARLKKRLNELLSLPKEDLMAVMDDVSNKQWLESKRRAIVGENANSKFAARSTPDGNCLFNTCSLLLRHNEGLASLLRMMTAIELYLNAEYYVQHPIYENAVEKGTFSTFNTAFINSLGNNVLEDEEESSNINYVKKTAISISEQYMFVPFICILGLSNVVGTPIYSCTKDMRDARLMELYNCCVLPKASNPLLSEPLFIFWSKCSSSMDIELDHFVPLFDAKLFNITTTHTEATRDVSFDFKVLTEIFIKIGMKRKNTILPRKRIDAGNKVKKIPAGNKVKKIPTAVVPLYQTQIGPMEVKPSSTVSQMPSQTNTLLMNTSINPKKVKPSSTVTPKPSKNLSQTKRNINHYFTNQNYVNPTSSFSESSGAVATSPTVVIPNNLSACNTVSITHPVETNESEYRYDISNFVQKTLTTDEKMTVIKNVWKPVDRTYEFPKNAKKQRFQHDWLAIYKWLTYSPATKGAWCLYCVLFGTETSQHNSRKCQLFTEPYFNWNTAKENFSRHEKKSPVHGLSVSVHQLSYEF